MQFWYETKYHICIADALRPSFIGGSNKEGVVKKLPKLKCLSLGLLFVSPISAAHGQSQPETMQFVECDFDKTTEVYGFEETPAKVVDGLNSALSIKAFEVSDYVVRFAYENPFKAIDLYAKWAPETTNEHKVTGLTVEINRLTGIGQLIFTRPLTDAEKNTCEQDRGWGCNDQLVVASARGKCRAVVRRF
ncbi:hypothetical protein [Altererythrobacter sp. GH1-8]|uniref:hypothetical protein n=1 Tax=Altererythrobacter sp. GH1-8 TaxID=3349333 RepID=UPI00374C9815